MLFPSLRQHRTPPVGLHVGVDGVRMVQLRAPRAGSGADAPAVAAAEFLPLPPECSADPRRRSVAAAGLAARALRRGPFVGATVVTSLPAELIRVRTFRLPRAASAAGAGAPAPARALVAGAAAAEAREAFSAETDGPLCVASIVAGQVRQGGDLRHEVLSFAATDADVRGYLEPFAAAGVAVQSLSAEPFAVYRAAGQPASAATVAAVHVADHQTQIVIGRGAAVEVIRKLDIGTAQLEQAAARKLGVSLADARELRRRPGPRRSSVSAGPEADPLASALFDATRALLERLSREVVLCLRYHAVSFRGAPPGSVRLIGPGARDPHLLSVLSAALPVPVAASAPWDQFDVPGLRGVDPADPAWSVALGLALRPASSAEEPEFLPSWYVEQRQSRERAASRRRIRTAAVTCGLLMSAAVGGLSALPGHDDSARAAAPAAQLPASASTPISPARHSIKR